MQNPLPDNDLKTARQICRDLRHGSPASLLVLYNRYQNLFSAFAKRRLFNADTDHVDDILANFWIELLNGKAICKFKGKSSLQTYLTVILNRRIIDANRKLDRDKDLGKNIEKTDIESASDSRIAQSPENILMKKEAQRLVRKAIDQLEEISPRDANYLKMHLDGLTYEEMAKIDMPDDHYNPKKLKKKTDAINLKQGMLEIK